MNKFFQSPVLPRCQEIEWVMNWIFTGGKKLLLDVWLEHGGMNIFLLCYPQSAGSQSIKWLISVALWAYKCLNSMAPVWPSVAVFSCTDTDVCWSAALGFPFLFLNLWFFIDFCVFHHLMTFVSAVALCLWFYCHCTTPWFQQNFWFCFQKEGIEAGWNISQGLVQYF